MGASLRARHDHGDAPRERRRGRGSEQRAAAEAAAAEVAQEVRVPAADSTRDPQQEHGHPAEGIWAAQSESGCFGLELSFLTSVSIFTVSLNKAALSEEGVQVKR